eukprot:NODE_2256_length_642_cov_211.664418_g1909_i0.p1 GENE.NODE_2256_length_642_cov_211.664418_g1909_i0~~NODE_2256_length_642_cov_211.664418_g1909_i0.p1  ORF type:complete len:176 (+),score=43.43 NODE_2256_length_642_cov_211.664418_g1909_i0:25-528(+)
MGHWWEYMGLATEECYPYPFPPCEHHSNGSHYKPCPSSEYDTPSCPSTCADGSDFSLPLKAEKVYSVSGEEDIQKEIYTNGPVEGSFTVYEDFVAYKSGVYKYTHGDMLGGHAIKIVGWGKEKGVKYWLINNSWNTDWGDNGTFKILRGTDECSIEDSAYGGVPAAF